MEPRSLPNCQAGACNPKPCNCLHPPKWKKKWPLNFSGSGSSTKPESPAQADQAITNALEEYETISIDRNMDPKNPTHSDFPSVPVFQFGDFEIQALFDSGPNPLVTSPSDSSHWGFHLTCNHCKSVWHIETGVSWLNYLPHADGQWVVRFQNLLDKIASIKPRLTLHGVVTQNQNRY